MPADYLHCSGERCWTVSSLRMTVPGAVGHRSPGSGSGWRNAEVEFDERGPGVDPKVRPGHYYIGDAKHVGDRMGGRATRHEDAECRASDPHPARRIDGEGRSPGTLGGVPGGPHRRGDLARGRVDADQPGAREHPHDALSGCDLRAVLTWIDRRAPDRLH